MMGKCARDAILCWHAFDTWNKQWKIPANVEPWHLRKTDCAACLCIYRRLHELPLGNAFSMDKEHLGRHITICRNTPDRGSTEPALPCPPCRVAATTPAVPTGPPDSHYLRQQMPDGRTILPPALRCFTPGASCPSPPFLHSSSHSSI